MVLQKLYFEPVNPLESAQPILPTKISRILECRLLIDPVKAKLIAQWLMEQVNAFEKQYGNIPSVGQQQTAASAEAEVKKQTTGVG